MASIIIDLLNHSQVYLPGQIIHGVVALSLEDERKTGGLTIICEGLAHVWITRTVSHSVGSGANRRTETRMVHHTSYEHYLNTSFICFGHDAIIRTILPGTYTYPFQFQLPFGIPSSFEYGVNHVKYRLEAIFNEKPWYKFDTKEVKPFFVRGVLDLNMFPHLRNPAQIFKDKSICCLCCKSGPIILRLSVPRTGYVPGEVIDFVMDVHNMSSRDLKTKISLYETITFSAEGHHDFRHESYMELVGPPVAAGVHEVWRASNVIPDVPPTNLAGCNIISVEYNLMGIVDVPGGLDLKGGIPIKIGTIPLMKIAPPIVSQPSPNLPGEGASVAIMHPNNFVYMPNNTLSKANQPSPQITKVALQHLQVLPTPIPFGQVGNKIHENEPLPIS